MTVIYTSFQNVEICLECNQNFDMKFVETVLQVLYEMQIDFSCMLRRYYFHVPTFGNCFSNRHTPVVQHSCSNNISFLSNLQAITIAFNPSHPSSSSSSSNHFIVDLSFPLFRPVPGPPREQIEVQNAINRQKALGRQKGSFKNV